MIYVMQVDADSTSTSTVVLDISGGIFHSSQEEVMVVHIMASVNMIKHGG